MHSICIDGQEGLVVKFEPTSDYSLDFEIDDCLQTAGYKKSNSTYTFPNTDLIKFEEIMEWTAEYFVEKFGRENIDLCSKLESRIESAKKNEASFEEAKTMGEMIKNKNGNSPNVSKTFCRSLMEYQRESVEHMMTLGNAANFSVPGSGKTTITYAAISRWLEDEDVEKILVIGPTASFLPWEEEYESCFGRKPRSLRISGDIAGKFHELGLSFDLFLMHFQTAMNRQYELKKFMEQHKTALIIDESHNIKSPDLKRWASTALHIAPYAAKRIVLSGTPMPNNAKDLWTQITFLWPKNYPLGHQMIYNSYAAKHGIGKYKPVLNSLFCRIKKDDLHLPKPKWHRKVVPLNKKQQSIYDAIVATTLHEIDVTTIRDQGELQRFRMAKMVRLLQTASNPGLLYEKSSGFDVDKDTFSEEFGLACSIDSLPKINSSIVEQIKNYSQHEIPSKMVAASELAKELVEKGNKVIIWNSFIHNMAIFKNPLLQELDPVVINGTIPRDPNKPGNRDELINEFKNNPECKVLIASPASLGESVSLHKNSKNESVCNHAIYLDRNFNGAQYIQSMDRIHRVGMDQSVEVNYHLIMAKNTIDEVIDTRLGEKWNDMLDALQDDMLKSLDINPKPDTVNPDEFNEDYKRTIDYLRRMDRRHDTNDS